MLFFNAPVLLNDSGDIIFPWLLSRLDDNLLVGSWLVPFDGFGSGKNISPLLS